MKMKSIVLVGSCLTAMAVTAQQGVNEFVRQQAYAEMQRVNGQLEVLQSNIDNLNRRVGALERGGGGDVATLKAEVATLRATVEDLRRQLQNQRGEIVRDLTGRISKMQAASAAEARRAVPPPQPVYKGRCKEYVVKSGDTLSLVAEAFNTKLSTLRELNNLKKDGLRIGQKLIVPAGK